MTQVQADRPTAAAVLRLRVGELVEVRSEAEILATLDERGEVDSLPFMPEMAVYCGQRLTVHKVAFKLCDTISRSGMRRMNDSVYLTAARCDGQAHGGCQTNCSFIWKESWLRRVEPGDAAEPRPTSGLADGRALLPLLTTNATKESGADGEVRYSCQATELPRAAPTSLPFRDLGQYVQDVRSGNAGVFWTVRAFLVALFNRVQGASAKVLPRRLRFRSGMRWGFLEGRAGKRTPTAELNLQPGELVRIKSKAEILPTLNAELLNRGMGFDEEMLRFCGQVHRVQARVHRLIEEPTGRMLQMKYPCIVLEKNYCAGAYNVSCPREFVPFWREIWLERVPEGTTTG